MNFGEMMSAFLWLAAAIILAIVEANTVQLVSIWFAVGALAAMIPAIIGMDFTAQFAVFTVVSILVLAITRPFVKKKLTVQKTETNSRALIGKVAKVIQPIDNLQSQGRVMVEDMDWSARSENGEPIDVGEEVLIKEIQGVKLIVEKILLIGSCRTVNKEYGGILFMPQLLCF